MLYKQVQKDLIINNGFETTSKDGMVCPDVMMRICIYIELLKEVVFLMENMLLSYSSTSSGLVGSVNQWLGLLTHALSMTIIICTFP